MRLSRIEQTRLQQPRRPLAAYTDAELDAMTWQELADLSDGVSKHTIRDRVQRGNLSRREALVKKLPRRKTSPLSRAAATVNLTYATLQSRRRRHPDTPLEQLLGPVLSPHEAARRAGKARMQQIRRGQRMS